MSHIETGNTKLSLSVFADIASALSVQTDELLYDIPQFNKTVIKQELTEIVDSCSQQDMCILLDVLKTLKSSLEKYKN